MSSVGMVRYFLPVLTAPFYYASLEKWIFSFESVFTWLVCYYPNRQLLIHMKVQVMAILCLGGDWIVPLFFWTLMLIALFWTVLCVVVIFRRQWVDQERLVFPVAWFGLEISRKENPKLLVALFFRNQCMWIGFGLAFFTIYWILFMLLILHFFHLVEVSISAFYLLSGQFPFNFVPLSFMLLDVNFSV